ncbi:MAG: alpha/beta hydrolase [Candidatus Eremiobacteraeota bacterium]|nr:alpha/beta hydrolase [Candidatus Eremiobacteraeota bacterium]
MSAALHSGDSGPVVIFVHGVGSTAAIWNAQLSAMSDSYRCYAVELRGNGANQPDPDPALISRSAFAQDVLAVADQANATRFHYVGCSLGGAVGFELWRRARERIASLTFVGSYAAYPNARDYVRSIESSVHAAGSMRSFARERAAKLGLPPSREAETIDQMAGKSVASYIATTRATWTGDYRELLGSITVPTLVVCGERDSVAPLERSEEIAAGIPGARLEVLRDAGHVANADNPAAFTALLRSFLENQTV